MVAFIVYWIIFSLVATPFIGALFVPPKYLNKIPSHDDDPRPSHEMRAGKRLRLEPSKSPVAAKERQAPRNNIGSNQNRNMVRFDG